MRAAGLLSLCTLVVGCVREPAPALCPDLVEGDLVVTEIAGPQPDDDTVRPYVELYNASGAPVDLRGIKVRFRRIDGSSETPVIVRRSLEVAPESYTVLGLDVDDTRASYVDYGFAGDFRRGWLSTAAIDVEACGTRIDRAVYSSLPRAGSWALGVTPPTAQANDDPANWCTDPTRDGGNVPGSPQQANPACP